MRRWLLLALLLLASAGVTKAGSCDVSIQSVISPVSIVYTGFTVVPVLHAANAGPDMAHFRSWVCITDPDTNEVYRESLGVIPLEPGADMRIEFPECSVGLNRGYWLAVCSLYAAGDIQPENDTISKSFIVTGGA